MVPIIHPPPIPKHYNKPNPSPKKHPTIWIIVVILIVLASKPFLEYNESGEPRLALWRKEKLGKELKSLEEAEQYVLYAETSGWYPCFSCHDNTIIYLQAGNIWKYGITAKGQQGRYGNSLPGKGLLYLIEFTGSLEACLKQEKLKIYGYALLPENTLRDVPLIRPPGNKQDN